MLKKSLFIRILIIAALLLVNLRWKIVSASPVDSETQSTILFVKPGADGDCHSWDTACELQTALFNAIEGNQIWVASGTYKPTTSSDRTKTFQLKSGVAIYGGFPDNGGAWEERDWETNSTTLSGDIGVPGDNANNSYHVVTGSGVDATAVLDGFTISFGNANGTSPNDGGGGMFNSGGSPSLTNVTFSGNSATNGGGMYNSTSNPNLADVTFSENSATSGGGIYNSTSNPTLTYVTFSNNIAGDGGGIFNNNSSPILSNVTFNGNTASCGGGMYNEGSSPTLTDVSFSGNTATNYSYGGGMYNSNSSPSLTNVTFSDNTASYGGGMLNSSTSNPTLTNVTFSDNSATGFGGGIYNTFSSPILTVVTFSGNSASSGGGIYNQYSSPSLTDITFSGNSAGDGGGMYNHTSSSPSLTNVTFSGNSATRDGGGLDNFSNSSPSLTNVTFSGNSATRNGGGMSNWDDTSTSLTNVTFSGNTATNYGGGIHNSGILTLTNVTLNNNSSTSTGGGISALSGTLVLRNSILWGNTWGNTPNQISGSATVTYSDVQGGWAGTGNINADPLLGPLTDNGGFTQTHALGENSPAIDVADSNFCPGFDQRYYARHTDGNGDGIAGCDMGAYEYGASIDGFLLSVEALGSGTVLIDPQQTKFFYGDVVTLTAIADENWVFTGWSGDASGTDNPITVTMDAIKNITSNFSFDAWTIALSVSPEGSGEVVANPDKPTYHSEDQVTLTALPNPGWSFAGWTGDASGTTNPTSVTMTSHKSITANFTQNEYTLSVTVNPEGMGSVAISPSKPNYHYGEKVTLTATPTTDWKFTGWSGDATGATNPLEVIITGNTNIIANFSTQYTLVTSVLPEGSGTITRDIYQDTYEYGTVITLTAVPVTGWTFTGWTGDTSGTTNPTSVTMTSHKSITANFTQNEYTLSVTVNPEGMGSVAISPSKPNYHYGEKVTLTATPPTHWRFDSWGGDASGSNNPLTFTLEGNTNITANFSKAQNIIYYVKAGADGDCLSWETACELQAALFTATEGDQIWVASGTYKPTTDSNREATFQLKNGVAIYGGFPAAGGDWSRRDWETNTTTLSGDIGIIGNNDDNSYHVVTGSRVDATSVLDGFTISLGNANGVGYPHSYGGGMYNESGSPSLSNVTFTSNSAEYSGGGMSNDSYSSPSLTNVTFNSNTAANDGGGMFNYYSSPTLTNVTFSGNTASRYGGGMSNNYCSPNLTNVTFSDNTANQNGGGMFNYGSSPSLTDVIFSANKATGDYGFGGGMYNTNYSSPSLTNLTFSDNTAYDGGGISNTESSSPTLTDVTFNSNTAANDGGGMFNYFYSSPTLTNVTFSGNTASRYGGGMSNNYCSPNLTNVTFSGNTAIEGGGGMNEGGSSTLTNVTFSGNTATGDYSYGGGMLITSDVSPTLTNVTFSGNTANSGGGLCNRHYSYPNLTNVTFSGNTAIEIGGGMYNFPYSSPTLTNSIVWDNKPDQINNAENSSPTITYSDIQGDDVYPGDGNINENPLLGNLADNGGFTQTHAIAAGSPAIDAGDPNLCPDFDQRGVARPIDGDIDGTAVCDMGAYEYGSTIDGFTLTVNVSGNGSVDIVPLKSSYLYGEIVTLTATPSTGWKFTGWSGDVTSIDNPLVLTITGNTSITANFTDTFYIYLPLILKN